MNIFFIFKKIFQTLKLQVYKIKHIYLAYRSGINSCKKYIYISVSCKRFYFWFYGLNEI